MGIKKYLYNTVLSARSQFEYRFDFVVTLFSPLIFLYANLALWNVIGSSTRNFAGLTSSEIIWYYYWGFLLTFLSSGGVWKDIGRDIRDGNIINDFLKPINFFGYYYSYTVGRNLVYIIIGLLGLVCSYFYKFGTFDLRFIVFIGSALIAFHIEFIIKYIIGLISFWHVDNHGFFHAYNSIGSILSGGLIPLQLLGKNFYKIAVWLPFQGIRSAPLMVVTRGLSGLGFVLISQVIWLIILIILSLFVLKKGAKRIEFVGI